MPTRLEPLAARQTSGAPGSLRPHAGDPLGGLRPVKIVRLIARLNVGGPAIHAILLARHLNQGRHRTLLVTGLVGPREGSMEGLAAANGVRPLVLPDLGRELSPRRDGRTLVQLTRLLRRVRPDVVHTHTAKAGTVGRLAARLAGVPVVVHTFHGHVFHSYFGPLKTRLFLGIERNLAHLTDSILTVGPRQREEILGYGIGNARQVRPVPLGLELARFAPAHNPAGALRAELGLPADALLVGIVGRLVPVKDHATFLAAAAQVASQESRAHFLVVGDGELRAELEARTAALGLTERVRFLGWRDDLPRLYADLDLVVLSSRNEGSPVALIEALSAGCPVVATDVGGVRDVVRPAQSPLVPAGNPTALAATMAASLAEPATRERARAVSAQIRAAYAIERLAGDLAGLYDELLARKTCHKQVCPAEPAKPPSPGLRAVGQGALRWPRSLNC